MREVRLDDHESGTTTGQRVPAFDSLGMVRAQLVLLNQAPGYHRPVNSGIPREPAIEEHAFLLFARSPHPTRRVTFRPALSLARGVLRLWPHSTVRPCAWYGGRRWPAERSG